MLLDTEKHLGVIVVEKNAVFTPRQPSDVRFNWPNSIEDDFAATFSAKEIRPSDDTRLKDELDAWDAASDEVLFGLNI